MSLTTPCPYCGVENKIDLCEDVQDEGLNMTYCNECEAEFWFEARVHWTLHEVGKTPTNKPTFCPHCQFDLSPGIDPWATAQTSMCPSCHQPYSVKVEKEEQVKA